MGFGPDKDDYHLDIRAILQLDMQAAGKFERVLPLPVGGSGKGW